MGGHAYYYVVNYQKDVQAALDELRDKEFKAGRYNPVIRNLEFPLTAGSPSPGPKHATIEEAREASGEEGTRSILDVETISDTTDFFVAAPLSEESIESYYGTTKPTRAMFDDNMEFLEEVERGECVYFTLYRNDQPDGIVFAGYSFD